MYDFCALHNQNRAIHIDSISNELKNAEKFSVVSDIFKQLSDTARIRIFWLLCHKSVCVSEISSLMNMSSPAVCHHLRSLSECNLIQSSRVGKEVYYKANSTDECELLHKMIEVIMEMLCPVENISEATTPEETAHIIHDYLIEHISERITIEELSKIFLMNTTTIKTAFKNVYGCSLAFHIKKHRMDMASELLLSTPKSVSEIASMVGYGSKSQFTNTFKDYYGVLPTAYRNTEGR